MRADGYLGHQAVGRREKAPVDALELLVAHGGAVPGELLIAPARCVREHRRTFDVAYGEVAQQLLGHRPRAAGPAFHQAVADYLPRRHLDAALIALRRPAGSLKGEREGAASP